MTDGVVKFAVDKLEEIAVQELKLQTEVGRKVLELRHELEWLRTFLRDADRRRRQQAPDVDLLEVWVRQTRELAHDAEDLLDEFLHRGELHCHGCFDLPSFLRWLRHSAAGLFTRHAIFDDIEEINTRIQHMKKQRKEYNLEKLSSFSKPHRKQYTDWSTLTALEIEDHLVNIEDYKDIVDEKWFDGETTGQTVIVLTGKAGIGKTTLARSLYRRSDIRKHFTCTAWIHVPHKFRFVDLFRDIIHQLAAAGDGGSGSGSEDLGRDQRHGGTAGEEAIEKKLADKLQQEKYLIVLDDVRSREEWEFFLTALPAGRAGSRVLVTTQLKILGEASTEQSYRRLFTKELKKLDSRQAADLFCKRVYGRDEQQLLTPVNEKQRLRDLVDPVTKGSTLPLNVVMLAGLLRSKKGDEWKGVIDSLNGDTLDADEPQELTLATEEPGRNKKMKKKQTLETEEAGNNNHKQTPAMKGAGNNDNNNKQTSTSEEAGKNNNKKKQMAAQIRKPMSTETILTACMDDLPPHLKPCILYFAGFTTETPIDAGKLLRLWVAEGFVQPRNGQTTEERGEECLKELISRCLVQLVETDAAGNLAAVSVHQVVLDFVQAEAHHTNFLHVHSSADGLSNGAARRLALRNTYDSDLSVVLAAPKLHSFLCDIPEAERATAGDDEIWHRAMAFINGRGQIFSIHASRFLRVLDLKGVQHHHGRKLPEEIGWLIHLRYLGLAHTAINELPKSVRKLSNLQTLDVWHTDINALPWRFWHIPSLRHVLARRLTAGSAPDENGVLNNVQTLHGVPWGQWARRGAAIEKMTNLRSLMAWNVVATKHDLLSALGRLECLRSLDLEGAEFPLNLFAMLGLRQLQYLTLRGSVSGRSETTSYLLPNLAKLELYNSGGGQDLVDVLARLPNLAELALGEGSYVETELKIPAGGFPKLKEMRLSNLDKLTKCTVVGTGDQGDGGHGGHSGTLSRLKHMSVFRCKKLMTIFEGLDEFNHGQPEWCTGGARQWRRRGI
ncbi:hypothetical protein GUJ93_ZPchr0008g13454 [Zizania palustris]|uniref:AAA+ ATPase domain-containing protein n=1 Tax=Zizania palustris TaxID=103762 RepID=A0A8J5QYI8_ZIZPA|nr:hypothetical protein GUJ93_ZPchr0008g13454 [Zizania palustris]